MQMVIKLPLPADTIEKLQEFASVTKPLDESIRYEFAYLCSTDVKNLLPIKAPHYICLYSEKKENYLMNAGFLLQQVDLYLSDNNLVRCWNGKAHKRRTLGAGGRGFESLCPDHIFPNFPRLTG